MVPYFLNLRFSIQTLPFEQDVVVFTVAIKEIGYERILGFLDYVSVQRVIDSWLIIRAHRQKIPVQNRLQLFVHQPRPCKTKSLDLQRNAHVDISIKFCLPKGSQLPTTARQVLQNPAAGQAMKNLSNG